MRPDTTALAGVTLDLRQADPDTALSFEVTTDSQRVEDSVRAFVDAFNSTLAVIERHAAADRTGQGQSGTLAGDPTLRSIKAELIASVSGRVTPSDGASHDLLSAVGVSYSRTGRLELNTAKLREQEAEDPERVANLFLTRGTASSGAFRLAASSSASQAGTYAVDVTSLAEQATLLGDNAIDPGGLAQDESLSITVGGTLATANLLAGNNESDILQRINDALGDAGIRGLAESIGGRIRITTNAYGSAHQVSVASSVGSIAGSVGFEVTDRTDSGADVVGTLGGLAATGTGQVLTGTAGGATAGLLVAVTGSGTGNLGDLTFRVGLSERLDRAIDAATKRGTGRLPPLTSTLQTQVRSQETRIERLERQLTDRADSMRQRFTAAQSALSSLQAMQGSLKSLT